MLWGPRRQQTRQSIRGSGEDRVNRSTTAESGSLDPPAAKATNRLRLTSPAQNGRSRSEPTPTARRTDPVIPEPLLEQPAPPKAATPNAANVRPCLAAHHGQSQDLPHPIRSTDSRFRSVHASDCPRRVASGRPPERRHGESIRYFPDLQRRRRVQSLHPDSNQPSCPSVDRTPLSPGHGSRCTDPTGSLEP